MNKPLCCGQPVRTYKKDGSFFVSCDICKRTAESKTANGAYKAFAEFAVPQGKALAVLPKTTKDLPAYYEANIGELMKTVAPFMHENKPALQRMVKRNMDYAKKDHLKGLWKTERGIQSLISATEEAFSMGLTLGETGSIVGFREDAVLVPDVEGVKFCLTTGSSSPFLRNSIEIEPIYSNDRQPTTNTDPNVHYGSVELYKENGNMTVNIVPGCPRGEPIQVVVYGTLREGGKVVGEVFDKQKLLNKAKSSNAYKIYLLELEAFKEAKSEGRVKKDGAREYYDREIEGEAGPYFARNKKAFLKAEKEKKLKKDSRGEYCEIDIPGKDWKPKVYRHEIENPGIKKERIYRDKITSPYAADSGNQEEMLCKLAGKSFLNKWRKVRNSEAAMNELTEEEEMSETLMNAVNSFEADKKPDDIETEFEIQEEENADCNNEERENSKNETQHTVEKPDIAETRNNTDKNPDERPQEDAEEKKKDSVGTKAAGMAPVLGKDPDLGLF